MVIFFYAQTSTVTKQVAEADYGRSTREKFIGLLLQQDAMHAYCQLDCLLYGDGGTCQRLWKFGNM